MSFTVFEKLLIIKSKPHSGKRLHNRIEQFTQPHTTIASDAVNHIPQGWSVFHFREGVPVAESSMPQRII